MSSDNTRAIYTNGSVFSEEDAISKIQQRFNEFGEKKYVDIVGLEFKGLGDLPKVQAAFPDHDVKGHRWGHTIRPKTDQIM